MRWLWVAVVAVCLFTLWARYPADAFGCAKVQGYVQSFGRAEVVRRAGLLGYRPHQMRRFQRYCARRGIRF